MMNPVFFRISRILLSSAAIGLLAGLALAACANGTPEVEIILPDTATPSPTQPAPSPAPLPSVSSTPPSLPSPTFTPLPAVSPDPVSRSAPVDLKALPGFYKNRPPDIIDSDLVYGYRVWPRKEYTPSPASTMFLFDGNPTTGGTLITQEEIPGLDSGQDYDAILSWNLKGQAGEHHLYLFLCPAGVDPSALACQSDDWLERVPPLSYDIKVIGGREVPVFKKIGQFFNRGDVVPLRVYAVNLDPVEILSFTITTTARFDEVIAEEEVVLEPGEVFEQTYFYDTAESWGWMVIPKIRLSIGGGASTDFFLPEGTHFLAEPLRGTAPLTVTFIDRSTPPAYIESWLWSFGDGMTSTLQTPVHVYTRPGSYTVTLSTVTPTGDTSLAVFRDLDPEILDKPYTSTLTRSNYIQVLPPDEGP